MTFPDCNATLRTDASFDEMLDEDHHLGPTPLAGKGLCLVSKFVLDYMHLVCLGVMRRLILLWMSGPLSCRQGSSVITSISAKLMEFKHLSNLLQLNLQGYLDHSMNSRDGKPLNSGNFCCTPGKLP